MARVRGLSVVANLPAVASGVASRGAHESHAPYAVEAVAVTKRFPGVVANDRVNFQLARGEVHTLLGENGAGKSTLASVLCGLYRPEEGQVLRNGKEIRLNSPRDGLAHGIAMVHQHFRLVDRFTVAENVVLGHKSLSFVLAASEIESRVEKITNEFGLPLDPRAVVGELSAGERQRVEIVKALYQGAEVLLLDEPTALLAPPEVEKLFITVRAMTHAGKSVVFVSHKLGEVVDISDRITVMRGGKVTGSVRRGEADVKKLAELMVGREINLVPRRAKSPTGEVLLSVSQVHLERDGSEILSDINIEVRAGEIVGVAGVAGNGQRDLAEMVAGLSAPQHGNVTVCGQPTAQAGALGARRAGLAYVPEDRLGTGLSPSLSMVDNLVLTRERGFLVDRKAAHTEAEYFIKQLEIKTPGPLTPTRKLSGGNAQKVLLARELFAVSGARVLVVCSPTRGLDVGAVEAVHALLDEARDSGKAILLISEDLDEVMTLADRVMVLYRGKITLEQPGSNANLERVGRAMAGIAS
jgi:simple sugar transport system ATP-binding protein